mmetsp:Transcript_3516/g.10227  ORF Transcript_3516/g.10227 Transcript_3516/m.10227 type:complete len:259 (-) Transcript_3516:392-1168(-)
MAVTPLGPPSQAQFFGVVALGGIILVVTAAFMTQKPIWMTGQEPSLGVLRPFTEAPPPPPVFTAAQLKKIAEGQLGPDGQPVPPAAPAAAPGAKKAALTSLAAAEGKPGGPNPPLEKDWPLARQVAQKPGAMVHLDDQYTTVVNAVAPRYPATHGGADLDVIQFGDYPTDYGVRVPRRMRNQDTIVPIREVQMAEYPILNLQDERGIYDHAEQGPPGEPLTSNKMFAKALVTNGLGDGEYIETVAGGLGANSESPIDR